MFFSSAPKQHEESEDDLEILVLRLETSSYMEDKTDTLKLLYEYTLKDPISTGTYCLNAVMDTMNDLDDISYNIKILELIFSSSSALEFVDLFLKKEENIDILIECYYKRQKEVNGILELMAHSDKFRKRLIRCKNISFYLVNGLDNDYYSVLIGLIPVSQDFRQQLIFDGIFEKLLTKLETTYLDWAMKLICSLLKNNHFGQNYFIETNWVVVFKYIDHKPHDIYFLLIFMVDITNGNIKYIKERISKVVSIANSIDKQQHYFCYVMINNDLIYLKDFIDLYRDFSFNDYKFEQGDRTIILLWYFMTNKIIDFNNIFNVFQLNSALLLLSEVLFYIDKILILKTDEYLEINGLVSDHNSSFLNIDIIKQHLNLQNDSLLYKLLLIFTIRELNASIFQVKSIDIDSVIYMLFAFDTTKVQLMSHLLTEIVYDDSRDEMLISFCVLTCLMHEIQLNMNRICLLKHLKRLRHLLSSININNEFYLIDECTNILLDKINELIFKLSERTVKYE